MGQGDSKWDPTWGRARSGHGRPPFGETIITAWHLDRPETEQTLETIEWEVLRARRSGAFVAPAGTGRTHLLRVVADWINPVQWESVYVPNPMFEYADLCPYIAGLTGGSPSDGANGLEKRLEALWAEGRSLLLLVDDAEHMPIATVEALLELAERHSPTLVLLFACMSGAVDSHPIFGRDRETFPVVRHEGVLAQTEVADYLRHRLDRSGTERALADRFDDTHCAELHAMSGGIVMRLHALAQVLVETPASSPDEAWQRFLDDDRGIIEFLADELPIPEAAPAPSDAHRRESALRAAAAHSEGEAHGHEPTLDPALAGAGLEPVTSPAAAAEAVEPGTEPEGREARR